MLWQFAGAEVRPVDRWWWDRERVAEVDVEREAPPVDAAHAGEVRPPDGQVRVGLGVERMPARADADVEPRGVVVGLPAHLEVDREVDRETGPQLHRLPRRLSETVVHRNWAGHGLAEAPTNQSPIRLSLAQSLF